MDIFIKYSTGHSEWIQCVAYVINNNILEVTTDVIKDQDGHTLGTKQYIPLYNVEKFIPCSGGRVNRYVQ